MRSSELGFSLSQALGCRTLPLLGASASTHVSLVRAEIFVVLYTAVSLTPERMSGIVGTQQIIV